MTVEENLARLTGMVGTFAEMQEATHAADAALRDALIVTLVKAFPPLAASLMDHFELAVTHHRPDTPQGDTGTGPAYEQAVQRIRQLIDLSRPG